MATIKFREDIQGLRALAVMTVMLFHVDFAFLPGGFLGVDIFFVISGFLITGILLKKTQDESFLFTDFYIRRIRRLLPASLLTIALSLLAAFFIFSQTDFSEAGKTGLHAILFSSNIIFWLDAGYFDTSAYIKPFLHFWSLSVEEQFYLFWPFLIVFVYKFFKKLGAHQSGLFFSILILSILSLISAELLLENHPSASFFLMPFRIFEFGVGALLAINGRQLTKGWLHEIAFSIGLILMIGSMVFMSPSTPMPGLLSLFPVVGCMLCLMAPEAKLGTILRNPITTSIGNTSYSLYLAHWPPVVFYKYLITEQLQLFDQLIILSFGFIFGYLIYYVCENPMRNAKAWSSLSRVLLGTIFAIGLIYLSALIWATNGFNSTIIAPSISTSKNNQLIVNKEYLRQESHRNKNEVNEKLVNPKRKPVMVIGDSHGKDFLNVLSNISQDVRFVSISYWCQPVAGERPDGIIKNKTKMSLKGRKSCANMFENRISKDDVKNANAIVIAARWQDWSIENLEETIIRLKKTNATKIFIVNKGPEFNKPVTKIAELSKDLTNLNNHKDILKKSLSEDINSRIAMIAKDNNIYVIDKSALMCSPQNCPVINEDMSKLYYYDKHHITLEGTKYFANRIKSCKKKPCRELIRALKKK